MNKTDHTDSKFLVKMKMLANMMSNNKIGRSNCTMSMFSILTDWYLLNKQIKKFHNASSHKIKLFLKTNVFEYCKKISLLEYTSTSPSIDQTLLLCHARNYMFDCHRMVVASYTPSQQLLHDHWNYIVDQVCHPVTKTKTQESTSNSCQWLN